ncbi:MAG: MerR family DNA-binding transcriptional regulator [Proteobacteria bacterium]|nr:MerR family DNA-binding transcriptional regulator [Pseudomonadota bacterium]
MTENDKQAVTYSISELSREFQVTSRALRLYEEEGLLSPQRVGTRRIYSERERVRLRLVLRGKRLGWSLSDIKESFNLYDSSHGEEAQLERFHDARASHGLGGSVLRVHRPGPVQKGSRRAQAHVRTGRPRVAASALASCPAASC